MSDERWRRIEELFHHAADLAPERRGEYLTRECAGDDDLRKQVESLLANDKSRDEVIGAAVAQAVAQLPSDRQRDSKGHLSAGSRLGPYEISTSLGAGGMGVVYKARDTRLGRSVALKVLPPELAADAERLRRFEQEARAASALNHPNILSVYDFGRGGDTWFIVTELVNGETLRALLQRQPISIRKLLDLAVQIADGLAAAHAAGIVHRDLKPENIMVTPDGRVKIVDFGIAKIVNLPLSRGESTKIMTAGTQPGIVLGTVAYLSPEQARGSSDIDGRSDQFSFGLVLYELATGTHAFDRPSAAETMSAIIREEVPALPGTVPAPIRWVIERCLAKERIERYDSTHDLYLELRQLRDHAQEIPKQIAPAKRSGRLVWLWGAVLLAAAAVVSVGVLQRNPSPSFERLTYRRGDIPTARLSPDGQTVVFSAQWAGEPLTIFSTRPGSREYRPLELPAGRILSISSAGEMAILLGVTTPGTLARVPLSGGAPREILENVNDADWSPDGNSLAVSRAVGGKNQIEYPIGTVRYMAPGGAPLFLKVSPKGDLIAFFEPDSGAGDYAVTVLGMNGKKRVLSRGWQVLGGLTWSPNGNEIWFGGARAGGSPALRAVSLGGKEHVLGEMPAWTMIDDIRRDGNVLLTIVDSRLGISGLLPQAKQERDLSWFDASNVYDISDDGHTILFIENSYGKVRNPAIYLRRTDGAPAVRLGDGNRPALSPDGGWVACISIDGLKTGLTLLPTGAGEAQNISIAGMHYERVEWFPKGNKILFIGNEAGRPIRTFMQDVRDGKPTPITPEGVPATRVSPDGKYVTAMIGGKLCVVSIGGGEPKPLADTGPGESVIRWSGDGRYLFLRQQDGRSAVKISRVTVATGRRELWKELQPPDPAGVQMGQVVMTPDGNAYAYSFQRDIATLYLAKGLK